MPFDRRLLVLVLASLLAGACGVTSTATVPPRERPGGDGQPEQFGGEDAGSLDLEPRDALPQEHADGGTEDDGEAPDDAGGGSGPPDQHQHQGAGDAGQQGPGPNSCRSENRVDGELIVYCAEWEGSEAGDLFTFCTSPGSAYQDGPCDREASVGECTYVLSQGLTIRNVWYEDPEAGESSCTSSDGLWTARIGPL